MSAAKKKPATPEELERKRKIGDADALLESHLKQAADELVWAQEKADKCTRFATDKAARLKGELEEKHKEIRKRKAKPTADELQLMKGEVRAMEETNKEVDRLGKVAAAKEIAVGKLRHDQRVPKFKEHHAKTIRELKAP